MRCRLIHIHAHSHLCDAASRPPRAPVLREMAAEAATVTVACSMQVAGAMVAGAADLTPERLVWRPQRCTPNAKPQGPETLIPKPKTLYPTR